MRLCPASFDIHKCVSDLDPSYRLARPPNPPSVRPFRLIYGGNAPRLRWRWESVWSMLIRFADSSIGWQMNRFKFEPVRLDNHFISQHLAGRFMFLPLTLSGTPRVPDYISMFFSRPPAFATLPGSGAQKLAPRAINPKNPLFSPNAPSPEKEKQMFSPDHFATLRPSRSRTRNVKSGVALTEPFPRSKKSTRDIPRSRR